MEVTGPFPQSKPVYFLVFLIGLFDIHVAKNQAINMASYCRIMFKELVKGLHPNVRAMQFSLHDDWVKKVKYYPSLQCFISCATTGEKSLYVGDALRKRISSYINIRKGVLCFDYCSTWNVIVTGGIDHYVRLWNPYLTTKPTSTLKGHCSAVIHISVNGTNGQFISVSQDKVGVRPVLKILYQEQITKLSCLFPGVKSLGH